MERDQLKVALTEMGVAFANNAPTEKLQALHDEALAGKSADESSASGDEISEEEIQAKVVAGLDRAQAIEVITNQRQHDKQLAGD